MNLLKKTTKPVVITEKNIVSIFRKAQRKLEQQNKTLLYAVATKKSVRFALRNMGYTIKGANKIIKEVWK